MPSSRRPRPYGSRGRLATLEAGRRTYRRERTDGSWVGAALGLGALFLIGQVAACLQWTSAGIGLGTTAYSSFFYVLTAAHALHVVLGVGGLAAATLWPRQREWRGLVRSDVLRVVAIYWHFMTVIWIAILLLLVLGR